MKLLSLNTAFNETYVVVKAGEKIYKKTMDSSLKQSENVLGAVDKCLSDANLEIKDLDCIACVIGPGSFTGIRIGASLCKGFCMACKNIKKIEINSLDLLAFSFAKNEKPQSDFYVILNGLSGNIFVCKYNYEGNQITSPCLMFGEEINSLQGIKVGLKQEEYSICNKFIDFNCEDLLSFSLEKISKGEYSFDYVPLYLRKSQAEAELDKRNGNS